jgi:hypothetical protein
VRSHASHEFPFTVSDTFTHQLSGRHCLQLLSEQAAILALLFHHRDDAILTDQDHHIALNRPDSIRISDIDLIVCPAIRITAGTDTPFLQSVDDPPRPSSQHVAFVPLVILTYLLIPSQF